MAAVRGGGGGDEAAADAAAAASVLRSGCDDMANEVAGRGIGCDSSSSEAAAAAAAAAVPLGSSDNTREAAAAVDVDVVVVVVVLLLHSSTGGSTSRHCTALSFARQSGCHAPANSEQEDAMKTHGRDAGDVDALMGVLVSACKRAA